MYASLAAAAAEEDKERWTTKRDVVRERVGWVKASRSAMMMVVLCCAVLGLAGKVGFERDGWFPSHVLLVL